MGNRTLIGCRCRQYLTYIANVGFVWSLQTGAIQSCSRARAALVPVREFIFFLIF